MNQMDFNSRPQNFSRRMPGTMNMPRQPMQQPGGMYGSPMNNGMVRQPMGGGNFGPRPGMNNGMAPMQGGMAPMQGGMAPMHGGMAPMQGGMAPMQGGMAPMQGGYGRPRNFRTENINSAETIIGMGQTPDGERWDQVRLGDVRDNLSKDEADARLDQMDDFIEKMKGTVDLGVSSPGNVDQLQSSIKYLVELLLDTRCWLPTDVSDSHREQITNAGAIVAKKLHKFSDAIAIATRTAQLPPIEELMPQSRHNRQATVQQQPVQQQGQYPQPGQYQQQPYVQPGQPQYQQQAPQNFRR